MSRHYDFAVIGGRLSAVLTAALLARRGLRGVLVDQGELSTVGSHGLSDTWVRGSSSSVMERVHDELGAKESFKQLGHSVTPLVQVVLPDARFDFTDGDGQAELARGLGLPISAVRFGIEELLEIDQTIGAYLSEGPEIPVPAGFLGFGGGAGAAKRVPAFTQDVTELQADPALVEFFARLVPFVTYLDPEAHRAWTVARLVRPVARLFGGVFTAPDGSSDRDMFLDGARTKGLDVRATAVERLEAEGRAWSIDVAGGKESVLADVVIDASSDLSGIDQIPARQRGRTLPNAIQAAKPTGRMHVHGIEVDKDVLPPPLACQVLLANGRNDPQRISQGDLTGDRDIWMTMRPSANAGRVQLIMHHPVSSVEAHRDRHVAIDDVIRARLTRLVPFLEDGAPDSFNPLQAGKKGPPLLSHPFFDHGLDEVTGFGGVSMRTGFKNLWLAGPAVIPGLGREGEYLSALLVSDAATAQLDKKR